MTFPLTEPARTILSLAQREARRLNHGYVGTEHVLLALLEAEGDDGPLRTLGLDKDGVEAEIDEVLRSLSEIKGE